jgi:Zn-dependent peptidase ImmA (M78 family)
MLFTSGKSSHSHLTHNVFEFFTTKYDIDSDVEVCHTDLSDDNAFGFTEVNGDEQFIQIHNKLNEKDYITTLMHELVHVVQNENGQFDDEERENEAYSLESILFNQFSTSN